MGVSPSMVREQLYAVDREKRCLIVSPYFPPSTLAGVHRARHLAKYLPAFGWQPTIVCVDPRHHIEGLDPELARLVPTSVRIVRAGAIPAWLTRPIGIAADIGLRGYFHLRSVVAKEMRRERVDAVLITGSPYYPMLMTEWIQRCWNVPVVLDFQDPWVSHVGEDAPRWSKLGISHRLAVALEPKAVRHATFITSVSMQQNEEMASRYPWLHRARMSDIPIGGDPEDLNALRSSAAMTRSETDRVVFSYVGTALPRSGPLLHALFRGLAQLRGTNPRLAERIRFRFVGTSNQPNDSTTHRVRPIAESEQVADLVSEEPARVPFLDALGILATTDVVLLVGSDEPHYTASKIYPGLMSGRPFLSIFHRMSSSYEILVRAGGGLALSFGTTEELSRLIPAIAEGLERLVLNPGSFGQANPDAYSQFTARAVAGQFAQVFEQATKQYHPLE